LKISVEKRISICLNKTNIKGIINLEMRILEDISDNMSKDRKNIKKDSLDCKNDLLDKI